MSFYQLYDFLERLQKNNHKEWMDAHRKEYYEVRDFYINWLDGINEKLATIDDAYFNTPGKKAINRINNNLLYHPNRPTYKDHFGAGLDQVSKQGDFFIELGVNESLIEGGYWHPSGSTLKSIRDAIDYDGDTFKKILSKKSFKDVFGGLIEGNSLKTAPKGYALDHEHIDLLKRRTFAVSCSFTKEEVQYEGFSKKVVEIYKEMLPFRRYLNHAITV